MNNIPSAGKCLSYDLFDGYDDLEKWQKVIGKRN
jgi:hypothetical protein